MKNNDFTLMEDSTLAPSGYTAGGDLLNRPLYPLETDQLVQLLQFGTPDGEETNDVLMDRQQVFHNIGGARIRTLQEYEFTAGRFTRFDLRLFPIGRGNVMQTSTVNTSGGIRMSIQQSPTTLQEHVFLEIGTAGGVLFLEYQEIDIGVLHSVAIETFDGQTFTVTVDGESVTQTFSAPMVTKTARWIYGSFVDDRMFYAWARIQAEASTGVLLSATYDIDSNPRYGYVYDTSGNNRHADIRNLNPDAWKLFYRGDWYNWPKVADVNCIKLDGINDYVKGTATGIVTGLEYEVQMFFKCNDATNTPFLYDGEGDHWINLTATGDVNISYNTGADGVVTAGTNYADGNWHSVRFKSEAGQGVFLYVDGLWIGRDTTPMVTSGIGDIFFGTSIGAVANFLNGEIGFVIIRKADQIEHLFPMQEGAETTAYDVYGSITLDKLDGVTPATLLGTSDDVPSWNLLHGCSDGAGGFIPAKFGSNLDALGNPIERPAGYVHNGCEVSLLQRETVVFSASNVPLNEVHAIAYPQYNMPVMNSFRIEFKCVPNGIDECNIDVRKQVGPPHVCRIRVQPAQVEVGIWTPNRTDYTGSAPVANEVNEIEIIYLNGVLTINVNGSITTHSGITGYVPIAPEEFRVGRAGDGPPTISNGMIYDVIMGFADSATVLGQWYCRVGVGRVLPDSSTYNNALTINQFGAGDPWDDQLPVRGPNFWTDVGGTVYEKRSYAQLRAHINSTFNQWFGWETVNGNCLLKRGAEYKLTWVPTAEDLDKLDDLYPPCEAPSYSSEDGLDTYVDESGLNIYTGEQ
jgi:hypothetical protein